MLKIWSCFSVFVLFLGLGTTRAEKKPWQDKSHSVGDIKIHYIEAGTGDRYLVFIPGLMTTAEIWSEQIPYFVVRGFHVIAIDPRSHGQTTKTEDGNTYTQQAADLFAFFSTLEIRQPYLVGWSAGVTVLLEYISSPDTGSPAGLVLVDGSPYGLKEPDYPGGMTMQQARSFLVGLQNNRDKFTRGFVQSMFKSRQPELRNKQIYEGCLKTPAGTVSALFFDLFSGDRRTALLRISVPTLIFVPEERRSLGEYLQSKIEKSKLEVISDVGHALFIDKPQTFNQLLEGFLEAN